MKKYISKKELGTKLKKKEIIIKKDQFLEDINTALASIGGAINKERNEIVIIGNPNSDNHNCDYMGCPSTSHVIMRAKISSLKIDDIEETIIPVDTPFCGKCGAFGVKIYRDYGSFRRPENDRCNECLVRTSWMIPCILDENGSAYGYSSVPERKVNHFYSLKDKDESGISPMWWKEVLDVNCKKIASGNGWTYNLNSDDKNQTDILGLPNIAVLGAYDEIYMSHERLPAKFMNSEESKKILYQYYSNLFLYKLYKNLRETKGIFSWFYENEHLFKIEEK